MKDGTFKKHSLISNMRLRQSGGEDTSHNDWLLRLGSGQLPYNPDLHPYSVQMPQHLCMPPEQTWEDLVEWAFPDVLRRTQACLQPGDNTHHDAWLKERALLSSRNDVASAINHAVLDRLDAATEIESLYVLNYGSLFCHQRPTQNFR